jgi:signal transduction histidine kinase
MNERQWTSGALAVVTLVVAILESVGRTGFDDYGRSLGEAVLVIVLVTSAAGAALLRPGIALLLLWLLLASYLTQDVTIGLSALIATGAVAFGCGRWGRRGTLVASAVSIPLVCLALVLVRPDRQVADLLSRWGLRSLGLRIYEASPASGLALASVAALVLAVPWLIGVTVRLMRRSAASEASQRAAEIQRDEAAEVAHLREAQAQLARDVHDVVGHSLTVILAQAEAAQYHPDAERVRSMMATIAETARASLADVRLVLDATAGRATTPVSTEVESLLAPIRAAGREVIYTEVGVVRPLPPDRSAVVHRLLQEMLTNAVRHGDETSPVRVERRWGSELVLQVSNGVAAPTAGFDSREAVAALEAQGHGLRGMRRRVESVGGRLEILLGASTFTVLATIPQAGRATESSEQMRETR